MFDVAPTELLLVAVVALVVIGPKDLPRVLRTVGHWVGKAKGTVRHFRSGIDSMIREAELEEMEKKWRAQNEHILQSNPIAALEDSVAPASDPYAAPVPGSYEDIAGPYPDYGVQEDLAPELPLDNPPAPPSEPKPDLP